MNYQLLASDIQSRSETLSGQTNAQIAEWYSTPSISVIKPVDLSVLEAYLHQTGVWLALITASNMATDVNIKGAATMGLALGAARYDNIDMTLPIVGMMLGALVAGGVITQAQSDGITALSTVLVSPWQSLTGVSEAVSEYDVLMATTQG